MIRPEAKITEGGGVGGLRNTVNPDQEDQGQQRRHDVLVLRTGVVGEVHQRQVGVVVAEGRQEAQPRRLQQPHHLFKKKRARGNDARQNQQT